MYGANHARNVRRHESKKLGVELQIYNTVLRHEVREWFLFACPLVNLFKAGVFVLMGLSLKQIITTLGP